MKKKKLKEDNKEFELSPAPDGSRQIVRLGMNDKELVEKCLLTPRELNKATHVLYDCESFNREMKPALQAQDAKTRQVVEAESYKVGHNDGESYGYLTGYNVASKEVVEEIKGEFIKELDNCFQLAPHDDEYLRILVADSLAYLKTGKRHKERQQ